MRTAVSPTTVVRWSTSPRIVVPGRSRALRVALARSGTTFSASPASSIVVVTVVRTVAFPAGVAARLRTITGASQSRLAIMTRRPSGIAGAILGFADHESGSPEAPVVFQATWVAMGIVALSLLLYNVISLGRDWRERRASAERAIEALDARPGLIIVVLQSCRRFPA